MFGFSSLVALSGKCAIIDYDCLFLVMFVFVCDSNDFRLTPYWGLFDCNVFGVQQGQRSCQGSINQTQCHSHALMSFFQGKELLCQKIPLWQQACAEPNKLPDRAMFLAQQMSGAAGTMPPGAHHPGMAISEPIPGAKPLPVPPELAALRASGGMGQQVSSFSSPNTCVLPLL